MSDFPDGECPDDIGRVAGSRRSAGVLMKHIPPLMWGWGPPRPVLRPCRTIRSSDTIIVVVVVVVVECYCFFIIYYCWEGRGAPSSPLSLEMATFT